MSSFLVRTLDVGFRIQMTQVSDITSLVHYILHDSVRLAVLFSGRVMDGRIISSHLSHLSLLRLNCLVLLITTGQSWRMAS